MQRQVHGWPEVALQNILRPRLRVMRGVYKAISPPGTGLTKRAQKCFMIQDQTKFLNAFITLADREWLEKQVDDAQWAPKSARQKHVGELVAVKDNICTADLPTTAASAFLKDFTSPYDATVVRQLRDAGCIIVGKTNMDEFGMGSHSTNSHFQPVTIDTGRGNGMSPGGSSGGSAVAVATGALGTDTGGSVRLPAAYTRTVGFKPSYGLLSRWGVIAYANSLDTVGIFAKEGDTLRQEDNAVDHVRKLFDLLNEHDPQDPTSLPPSTRKRLGTSKPKRLRVGIPLEYNVATLNVDIKRAWIKALRLLKTKGHTLHPVSLPATKHALSAYYILAPAEASSNLAKYDGVRYGSRSEGPDGTPSSVLFAKTRGQFFGPEVQRRILLGAFSLSADAISNYFIQAQKVRRLVKQDFDNVFASPNPLSTKERKRNEKGVDILLCPTAPTMAPSLNRLRTGEKEGTPTDAYTNDVFTVPSSLAGLPAINIPINRAPKDTRTRRGTFAKRHKFESEKIGMQIIGQYGDDKLVLDVAEELMAVDEAFHEPVPQYRLLSKELRPEVYNRGDMRHGGGCGFENTNGEIWPKKAKKVPGVGQVDRYPTTAEKKDRKRAALMGVTVEEYKAMKEEAEANGESMAEKYAHVLGTGNVKSEKKYLERSKLTREEYQELKEQADELGLTPEELVSAGRRVEGSRPGVPDIKAKKNKSRAAVIWANKKKENEETRNEKRGWFGLW
ncbi:amidase-domain-containing protein [Lophiostoma macrostomum CBS 122681]|uniref:Glutamyl-tRNA(Gln) amidotransferase subunit A, mitochondrial n=1 Tax=Lophiostoma macrostomum CBS 122681 TaxID=1314788 RepID=A0A6A6T370_9PLEO|nr:amidase-domain-containing protein [Lophiostoma macrostomum CBS 122681]